MTVAVFRTTAVAPTDQPQRKPITPGQLLIDGCWIDAGEGATMAVTDPTTEAAITHVQKASAADAERAIDAAYAAFETGSWGRMRHEDSAKILFRMADLLDERAEDFAIREAMDIRTRRPAGSRLPTTAASRTARRYGTTHTTSPSGSISADHASTGGRHAPRRG